ncbi:hypothetical protein ACSBOB_31860 [Mesorhizobium sp. ASY16-5R]|uniref:hypothetical protein n=1 Tax=Mesorhizobium sp. ASY16-5R TaxID=3445772 RepID=UPI003FA0A66C
MGRRPNRPGLFNNRALANHHANVARLRMSLSNSALRDSPFFRNLRRISSAEAKSLRPVYSVSRELNLPEQRERDKARENVEEFVENIFDKMKSLNEYDLKSRSNTNLSEQSFRYINQCQSDRYAMIRDVDNNIIHFDAYDYPFILVNDWENLRLLQVYVELYTASVSDPQFSPGCTIDNPTGLVTVIVSRIAPSLTPNGSIRPYRGY